MKQAWTISVLSVLALATVGQAQDIAKHAPRAVKTTEAPVSLAEARKVFVQLEGSMRKALDMPAAKPAVSIPDGTRPVSRTQVVAEFSRIYEVLRPKVKFTPRATPFDAKVVKLTDAKQRANLMALIKVGAVAKIGPLATGPSDNLTVPQFGDAVGFFMSRMAFITHLPSADWSATLKK